MSLSRETRRLSRAFGALVLALTPAAAAEACSDAASGGTADRALDAAATNEAGADGGAADAAIEAGEDAALCKIAAELVDPSDAEVGCRYTLPCGVPDPSGFFLEGCDLYAKDPPDGGDASLGCSVSAANGCSNGAYARPFSAQFVFECVDCFGTAGRRPVGLRRPRAHRALQVRHVAHAPHAPHAALGTYFARASHDEAASIHAFLGLKAELERFGAPGALVDAADRSARDEARHARMMGAHARRHGATPAAPRVRRSHPRSLEAFARQNAVEGCVLETFAALVMKWQAAHAADPSLRRTFAKVAADEIRHAALAWEVSRFACAELTPRARARVAAARARAAKRLRATVAARSDARRGEGARLVGMPSRGDALALVDGMTAILGFSGLATLPLHRKMSC